MCYIILNPCVTKGSGSMLQLRDIYAYVQTNMERAGYTFPSQLAGKKNNLFFFFFFSTVAEWSSTAPKSKLNLFLIYFLWTSLLGYWIAWANEASTRDMGMALLLLKGDIYKSKEKERGGDLAFESKQHYLQATSMFLHSLFSAAQRTSDCPRHEYLLRCALFLALILMLIVCLHLFAIQSEILFVLPGNTLLHVACIYLLTSHNNQCITLSPSHRLRVADYHQKWLIIKWNETTVFLWFSVISVPKWRPGLCL